MTSTPENSAGIPDEELAGLRDLALAALGDITPESTVGAPVGFAVEDDGVLTFRFENRLIGYPGWHWTVSLLRAAGDEEATVLESELLPGDDALLAPEWVPWADRLAEYEAAHAHDGDEELDETELVDDEDLADDEDDDLDEDDELDGADLHNDDDHDGVDIDSIFGGDEELYPEDEDSDDEDPEAGEEDEDPDPASDEEE